ncbi:MAG: hypothetical protein IT384_13710 [Deltaproteobacteria bacterium]|nr:hypothetical protein [Deltaproteobacteria bacterium]
MTLLAVGSSTAAAAEPRCPSPATLAEVLARLDVRGHVEVSEQGEALEVRLLADSGAVLGDKRIPLGEDCAARTSAIRVLVSAWTVDLRRGESPEATAMATATATATTTATTTARSSRGEGAEVQARIPTPAPFELGVSAGSALATTDFQKSASALRVFAAYDLLPFLAVELGGAWLTWWMSAEYVSWLVRETSLTPNLSHPPELRWMVGPALRWSLAEGIGFTELVQHARVYLLAGAALGGVRVQCLQGQPIDPDLFGAGALCPEAPLDASPFDPVYEPARLAVVGQVGGGLRIAFGPFIAAALELRVLIYRVRVIHPDGSDASQADRAYLMAPVFLSGGLSWLGG